MFVAAAVSIYMRIRPPHCRPISIQSTINMMHSEYKPADTGEFYVTAEVRAHYEKNG